MSQNGEDCPLPKYAFVMLFYYFFHCRNSVIRYTSRVNYDVACQMDFHAYPGDVQACDIKMESFGTTTDQMLFQWARGSGDSSSNNNTFLLKSSGRRKEKAAVTAQFHTGILGGCNVNENISLAQFSVLVYIHSVCLSGWTLYYISL